MEKKKGNIVWNFFASVKLALFTLFILAAASIIGTLVPQNDTPAKYIELYGPGLAKAFKMLAFDDMYSSWWFTGMLILFSLNLVVCTIERLPHIWKIVVLDNLATTTADRLQKMAERKNYSLQGAPELAITTVQEIMEKAGWKTQSAEKDGGTLLFSQKGAWTRLGVIIVHVSILVIFVGSLIGNFFGFKASVLLPEGSSTDKVYASTDAHEPIPLDGFTVRCDQFDMTYYDTGMVRDYISKLTVTNDDNSSFTQTIEVNHPLQYKGLTFYQSSYQAIEGQFSARITNDSTNKDQLFTLVPRREQKWREEGVTFGITNISGPDMRRQYRYKIWFSDGKAGPSEFWANEGTVVTVKRPETNYSFSVKPRFATGLQVVKDPGVWTVYIGCTLMLIGLVVIFYLSHRRVWVFISKDDSDKTNILVAGLSNKNKIGFENNMTALYEEFEGSSLIELKNS
nr:cytochrome c biogenesis protein ResB [Desulfobulbaceae bacterium]